MNPEIVHIGLDQLVFGLLLIVAAGITSVYHALNLERDLFIGTVRTVVQLFLLGYVLHAVFAVETVWLVLAIFMFMIFFAALTIRGRIKEQRISFFWPVFISMTVSYSLVSFFVTAVVVSVDPWWKPQFFIPLGGMVIGNSMNAIAIALERLLSELRKRRKEVEMMLCLGADYHEASQEIFGNAMRAGMIPSINAMMAAGVVFIPGMMTGQIIAGADPLLAIRYQIVVMVMLVGSTTMGTLIVLWLVRKLCFGSAQQLLLGA